MTVVRVDLRQPAVRARLREITPPAASDPFPFSDPSALTDLPVRLLLIVPLDDIAATDAEELALKLLGSDPSPRTLVALVAGVARPAGSPPRRLDALRGRCRRRWAGTPTSGSWTCGRRCCRSGIRGRG